MDLVSWRRVAGSWKRHRGLSDTTFVNLDLLRRSLTFVFDKHVVIIGRKLFVNLTYAFRQLRDKLSRFAAIHAVGWNHSVWRDYCIIQNF